MIQCWIVPPDTSTSQRSHHHQTSVNQAVSVIAAAMSQAEEIGVIVAGKNRQVRNGPNGPNGPNSGYLCVAGSICLSGAK